MKLSTIEIKTEAGPLRRIAALEDSHLIDLRAAYALFLVEKEQLHDPYPIALAVIPDDMAAFLCNAHLGISAAQDALHHLHGKEDDRRHLIGPEGERIRYEAGEVRLLAPVPRPTSIRDFLTFEGHLKGAARVMGRSDEVPRLWYEIPAYYRANARNVIGPEEPALWPAYTEKFDFELELAAVIGRKGKDISRDQAPDHIAGYTIFNDWSARDVQGDIMSLRMGPAKSKDFDSGYSLGPYLVTPDEINPDNLKMIARVNGEVWCEGNSREMHFKFADLIADVSRSETLWPGDVLASGTVAGGCGLELNRWIQPGDVIELEVEGIGVLRNSVVRA